MIQTQDLPIVPLPETTQTGKGFWDSLAGLSIDDALSTIANGAVSFCFKLLLAVAVFYAGRFIIRKLYSLIHKILHARHFDQSLTTFILSLANMLLYFILVITIVGILGLETSSFLAIFASAGVAIGMALSGTLQNFAGGVLILILKPYKVGDFIETQGYSGTVKAIQIFHTVINTPDNKSIIIPNGGLSTGSINNWSRQRYRRVQWDIGISYGDDFATAERAILAILADEPLVVRAADVRPEDDPSADNTDSSAASAADGQAPRKSWIKRLFSSHRRRLLEHQRQTEAAMRALTQNPVTDPTVAIAALADSSVNLTVRAWTRTSDYWALYNTVIRRIYTELPSAGVSFPFPQMDVHIVSTPS